MVNEISKSALNKKIKENSLLNAAYELFSKKGIHNTAISDIVKSAGVAKGTFYLYFKDKYDILDKIILRKSFSVLTKAYKATANQKIDNSIDKTIYFIDYIIEYLKNNKLLLRLIYKNLSWGLFRKGLLEPSNYSEVEKIFYAFSQNMDAEDIENTVFMILELTSSVCYSCIILNEPTDIEEIKPLLFKSIRKMLEK